MDGRLIEAAKNGDVDKLHNLIKDDPFLLRTMALAVGETPLHIACIRGHVNFVKEVLNLGPEFAKELNQDGFSPLHIASASGDIEIVKELLKVGCHLCLVKGKEKRIPLHCAVAKGRTEVIRELLSACQDSITEVTARGETCFHLAVKNNQFEAFKILCENVITLEKDDILNKKDEQGNTILHLAASRKQYEAVDLLLDKNFGYKVKLEVNSLNKKGLTPLDVLVSEGGDCEIEEMLTLAGAITSAMLPQNSVVTIQDPPQNQSGQEKRRDRPRSAYLQTLLNFVQYDKLKYDKLKDSPPEAIREMLLVIATLIATAMYSAMLSPPGGVWQDDYSWPDDAKSNSSTKQPPPHTAGEAILATKSSATYCLFLVFNSLGFYMSLQMIFFLTLGLPLQFEIKVAVFALTINYSACMITITPDVKILEFFAILSAVMPLITPIVTWLVRNVKIKGRLYSALPSARASS